MRAYAVKVPDSCRFKKYKIKKDAKKITSK